MATNDDRLDDTHHGPSHEGGNSKKRKHREDDSPNDIGMSQTPALLHQPDLPEFNLTSARRHSQDPGMSNGNDQKDEGEWQTVESGRARKKAKKIPKENSKNYPTISFSSNSRLQSQIKISDLQSLALYILADGPSPQFVAVQHRPEIRKVVVLMIPGLEKSMFSTMVQEEISETGDSKDRRNRDYNNPDDYYPVKLRDDKLPIPVKEFAEMFEYLWPVKTPGDDKYMKMHSPLHAMLTAPAPKNKEERNRSKNGKGAQPAKEPPGWKDSRTRITEFVHSPEDLLENDYTLHPAAYSEVDEKEALASRRISDGVSQAHGWVDTKVDNFSDGTVPDEEVEKGSLTAGREILAMDCEMCMTGEGEFSLTRISIVGWDASVVLDELVKPAKPITNYLTQYSGITEAMLANVTTTLQDIQEKLVEILNPRTILIGHSLNSDLTALKITHPFIIDTALIYPHPRGPPLKSSLKWLAQRYLNREIQKGHGTTGPGAGHDSIEDARTCLDLVKQKCEKGKDWGCGDSAGENIFKRVARTGVRYKNQGGSAIPSVSNGKSSAAVDWGDPKKGPGGAATFTIGCKSDEEIMEGIIRAVKGDADGLEIPGGGVDFVWARFRELEALKGWWNNNRVTAAAAAQESKSTPELDPAASSDETPLPTNSALPPPVAVSSDTPLSVATAELTRRVSQVHAALPPCTALIIYSGSGDPREMSRLQAMQAQFKREYKIKKWDQLSVKWTDVEEQALRKAMRVARDGLGFIGIK